MFSIDDDEQFKNWPMYYTVRWCRARHYIVFIIVAVAVCCCALGVRRVHLSQRIHLHNAQSTLCLMCSFPFFFRSECVLLFVFLTLSLYIFRFVGLTIHIISYNTHTCATDIFHMLTHPSNSSALGRSRSYVDDYCLVLLLLLV